MPDEDGWDVHANLKDNSEKPGIRSPGRISRFDSAAKPFPANFDPIKSLSAEIKASYRSKGIVNYLNVSERRRFDSENRGFCSGINF